MKTHFTLLAATILSLSLAACGDSAKLTEQQSTGPNPQIPQPTTSWFPTIHVAKASSWPEGATPTAAPGLSVNAFAKGLDHPRWLYVLPNGDVLVAESNKPKKDHTDFNIKAWVRGLVQSWVGAGVESRNRITLLRDADGDGIAEIKTDFITGLHSPFGMALIGDQLYVANTDAVLRFPYKEGETKISGAGHKVADLPGGPINHHWTKNIIASKDGTKLYATSGSNSNAAENGLDAEENRAAILEIDLASGRTRLFASGIRNPNGLAFEPTTGVLWTVVNERDELGSDLVPDYLTSVRDGGFYGWPFSYWGQHIDERVKPQKPELVAKAIVPDYALGNHVAPLGLTFAQSTEGNTAKLPAPFTAGAFIGNHGSWNRKPRSGYAVVFVPFADGKPSQHPPINVLTGFISADDTAQGRPVGVTIGKDGALLVADDVGNTIWRVTGAPRTAQQ
ncbi:MAG TPA: sorbosone dehydrogenase family protein [Pseudolabrys sp.]|nr:sorbosone dehydrogenase family protein [Pseudolabrys sp.]